MKRKLVLALTMVALTGVFFTGCGSNSNSSSTVSEVVDGVDGLDSETCEVISKVVNNNFEEAFGINVPWLALYKPEVTNYENDIITVKIPASDIELDVKIDLNNISTNSSKMELVEVRNVRDSSYPILFFNKPEQLDNSDFVYDFMIENNIDGYCSFDGISMKRNSNTIAVYNSTQNTFSLSDELK